MKTFGAIMLSMIIASKLFVYALHHPASNRIYIGKTTKGVRRPKEHFFPSSIERYKDLPRTKWIVSLRKRGLEAQWVVLEERATNEELCEAECFYIEYFRSLGFQLLNCTEGGDGILGHKHDEATREKMSQANIARIPDEEERRARMREMSQKRWADLTQHEATSERQRGKRRSPEMVAKMAASLTGKSKSLEHREAISKAMKEVATPEWKAKQSEIQREIQGTPEARERSAKAASAAWATEEYRQNRAAQSEEINKKISVTLTERKARERRERQQRTEDKDPA